ncbi:hypothetical protein HY947_01815 [Candidatus Gottesmanbacteria bacterium]|nr:hypothetical protein [Candidatus Gottesmanbacteria bacterium]
MDYKIVILPKGEEILTRLNMIWLGDEVMAEPLYQSIANEAGREMDASGLNLMLVQKISVLAQRQQTPMINVLLSRRIPEFIDVLVDDKEAAAQAKEIYEDAMKKDED